MAMLRTSIWESTMAMQRDRPFHTCTFTSCRVDLVTLRTRPEGFEASSPLIGIGGATVSTRHPREERC